jgi:hypothetical protein
MLKISLNNPESGWAYARLSDHSKESLVIGAPRKNKVELKINVCFRPPRHELLFSSRASMPTGYSLGAERWSPVPTTPLSPKYMVR